MGRGEGSGWGGQGGCEQRIEVFVKIQKKKLGGQGSPGFFFFFFWGGGGVGLGGQGGCERRIKVFGKIHTKKSGGGGGGVGRVVRLVGGQGGCEQRIEVFVKIQKENWGGGGRVGGVVRVDVNEELKFCENSKKKLGGRVGGVGLGGQGGCERRIEVL